MACDISTVLVRTLYASNVGGAARAMANMGGHRLILIDPFCEPLSQKSKMAAAGAQPYLEKLTVYDSWDQFYAAEGNGLRIAFTAREGRRREVKEFNSLLCRLKKKSADVFQQPVYLVFGPEDNGLDTGDLQFINFCASLNTFGSAFRSLNLAQAVLVANYVAQDFLKNEISPTVLMEPKRKRTPLYFPDPTIRRFIEAIGFDINARKSSAYLTLKKLLLENDPSDRELRVLEAILQQAVRKLTASKSLLPLKDVRHDGCDIAIEQIK